MDEKTPHDIDDVLGLSFKSTVWFSTDGKHTVQIEATSPEGRREGLEWGFKAYHRIVEVLGTKAQMWEGVMKNGNSTKSTTITQEGPTCGIHGKPMVWREGTSKSTGKSYAFWACEEKFANGEYCNYKPEAIRKGV